MTIINTRHYFGACPECGELDFSMGRMGLGGATAGICWAHATYWLLDEDLFPRVDERSDADFARNREQLKTYRKVEPVKFVHETPSLAPLIAAMTALRADVAVLEGLGEELLSANAIPRDLAMEWAQGLAASIPILRAFNNRLRRYVPTSEDEETRRAKSAAWTLEHVRKLLTEARGLSDMAMRNVESLQNVTGD